MTDHDLATLVRHHVDDEPPFHGTAADVVARGRRRLRRRRLGAVAGVAALTVVGVSAATFLPRGDTDGRDDRAVDPAIARAIDDYDARRMPEVMDRQARTVLAPSLPDLGPADFVAFDDQGQELPERYWDRASGLTTRYGADSDHRVVVTVNHSRGSAEGDPDAYCDEVVRDGYFLECTVDRTPDGDVVVTSLSALRPERVAAGGLQAWQQTWRAVAADEIPTIRPDRLWFSHDVKVIKSETFVTFTSEIVRAPDLATAQERLVVPASDLARIGLDRALVMPRPPRGDNGCPQWTMPTEEMGEISCTDADGEPLAG